MKTFWFVFAFLVLISVVTVSQERPILVLGCDVTADGTHSCQGLSAVPIEQIRGAMKSEEKTPASCSACMSVTTYRLASGALLRQPVAGHDTLLIALSSATLADEAKSPRTEMLLNGNELVFFSRDDSYRLRNIGNAAVTILLVELKGKRWMSQPASKSR
jgi:hypothetical protein